MTDAKHTPQYLTGQLLIAMPAMPDQRFQRSVIYICAHNPDGAMGLVINKLFGSITFPDLLEQLPETTPVLGVCLGHQCIVEVYGGRVGAAARLMHGKTSEIHHDARGVYRELPSPFTAGRYHSLAAQLVPDALEVSARSDDGEVMGVRHRSLAVEGVQFHPEALLTEHGHKMLQNFIAGGRP